MSRFARSIHIAAPAPDVWQALVDVGAWPGWASQFKRIELLDPAPLRQGSRIRIQPKGMLASTWRVTEYDDGRSFTWESSLAPGVRVRGGHVLAPEPDGSSAEFWLEASGVVGNLVAPLLRRSVFSRNTRNATEGLKRLVEGRLSSVNLQEG
jgi:uncharacterized membrane protein